MSDLDKNPRWLAVQVLQRVYRGAYSNLELNATIQRCRINARDVRLLTRLVYGVLQHRLTLRYDLAPFLRKPERLPKWLLILFETAVYQMIDLNRIPNRAIFNESIQIAKERGNQGSRRLMTGVLHQMVRDGLPSLSRLHDLLHRRSVRFSTPIWLIRQLDRQVGQIRTDTILASVNCPVSMSVRVNSTLTTPAKLRARLLREKYRVSRSHLSDNGLLISGKRPVVQTPEFQGGLLTIQDQSAMLPVNWLPIKKNDLVLDACAAPGGKTCQIAERLDPKSGGQVVALDLHRNRLNRVIKNSRRMRLSDRVVTRVLDARKVGSVFPDRSFNQILVDAPCSGLGLIRNKPEIRYFKSPADTKRLHHIQESILTAVAPKLKVGGHLVYSTCTILSVENEMTVRGFLARHPNYRPVPHSVNHLRSVKWLQLYPDDFGSDGFFICDLLRIK